MRMEPNSKLVIGTKLSILLLWLLLSELVKCQDTFPSLPPEEEKVLQTLKGRVDQADKLVICHLKDERSSSPCHVGIYCNTTCNIQQISLRNKDLSGEIPAEVGDLKDLRILDLSHNHLSGTIPGCLVGLSSLYSLDLSQNNLSGQIPPDLGRNMNVSVYNDTSGLTNLLFKLDLSYNKLNGTIPPSLGEIPPTNYKDIPPQRSSFIINLESNQLSGNIPDSFKKLKNLTSLDLSNNQLSGPLPPELGSLASIRYLYLNNNNFTDELPSKYSGLKSLETFSVAGNRLSGPFPNFIDTWTSIKHLDLEGNRFQGPIPPEMFNLSTLLQLGISDVENSSLVLPEDMNMPNISSLVLRNCSINGSIPTKLGENLKKLTHLDMSFNKLTGDIPESLNTSNLEYLSFAKNMLNGRVPAWIGDKAAKSVQIDLSFNYFSEVGSVSFKEASEEFDLNLFACCNTNNVTKSSFNLNLKTNCPKRKPKNKSLFINCGGEIEEEDGNCYENDNSTSPYYTSPNGYWAYTSSGYAYHDRIKSVKCVVDKIPLYGKARFSPVYLKYYGFCLHEGNYTVTLYFAEIVYTEYISSTMGSKNRMFDIYVQGNKTITDFNIKAEAEARKEKVTQLSITAYVNDTGVLEIEFYWAGRGSSRWTPPYYSGPLVSAISADFKSKSKLATKYIVSIVGGSAVLLIGLSFVFGRSYVLYKSNLQEIKTGTGEVVKLSDIKRATLGFSQRSMIGKGYFGTVHKAILKSKDISKTVAIKKLNQFSHKVPNQRRNEIYKSILSIIHENIVQLFDVYFGEDLSFVMYEYMDNKSLQDVLFDTKTKMKYLDWNKRVKICKGIAEALKYLHERQTMKMIHTGLKASNILLDSDFNAKLSDIGLINLCVGNDNDEQFKLLMEDVKFGYAAPEYASRNKVSFASDVFTFGVLVLEIVSGRRNSDGHRFNSYDQRPEFLTEKVCTTCNILELVDGSLITIDQTEARKILMLAKLCVNMDHEKRPTMSQIVSCLNNEITIDDIYKSKPQGDATTTETFNTLSSDAHFITTVSSGSTSPTY